MIRTALIAALAACAAPAFADDCEADLPTKAGDSFAGQVRYIVDGDGFCVSPSADKKSWIEVRLGDFDAPELSTPEGKTGKAILERIAMGKQASCKVVKGRSGKTTSWDRVFAVCTIDGVSVSQQLKAANAPEGGN